MPFVGKSPLEGVAESFQRGQQIGLARKAQDAQAKRDAQAAKVQEAQLEIARQEQERAAAQEARMAAREGRLNRSADLNAAAAEFDLRQARKKAKLAEEQRAKAAGMAPAQLVAHENALRTVVKDHPELERDARSIAAIAAKLPDPESRALFLQENTPALLEQANKLSGQKLKAATLDELAIGGFGDAATGETDPNIDAAVKDILTKVEGNLMAPEQAAAALTGLKEERVKRQAILNHRQRGSMSLQQEIDTSGAKPGSKEYMAADVARMRFEAGLLEFEDAQAALQKALNPAAAMDPMKLRQQAWKDTEGLKDELGNPLPFEQRKAAAEEAMRFITGEEAPVPPPVELVPLSPEDEAIVIQVRAKNPNATDAEIDAAIEKAKKRPFRSGKDRPTTR